MAKTQNVDLKTLFEEAKRDTTSILEKYNHMDVGEGRLYFIDKRGMNLLTSIKARLSAEINSNSDKKRYSYDLIAKLINENMPAQHYSIAFKGRHRQINDGVKVRENLEGELAIWKNVMRKNMHKMVELHNPDEDTLKAMENELDREIKAGESHFELIEKNFDEYEVRIAGWEREKSYPLLTYTCNGKSTKKHLSVKVPSVLYFEWAVYRSDMKVSEFTKKAVHAFGDVYYMKKGN